MGYFHFYGREREKPDSRKTVVYTRRSHTKEEDMEISWFDFAYALSSTDCHHRSLPLHALGFLKAPAYTAMLSNKCRCTFPLMGHGRETPDMHKARLGTSGRALPCVDCSPWTMISCLVPAGAASGVHVPVLLRARCLSDRVPIVLQPAPHGPEVQVETWSCFRTGTILSLLLTDNSCSGRLPGC
jgi:hypothetical protein